MSPPAGSLRLIKRHIQELRISRTTFIVILYLTTNVLGRLSVAIFGLAYNMMDKTGIEYPILATNWTSAAWASYLNTTTNEMGEQDLWDAQAVEGKHTTLVVIVLYQYTCTNTSKKSCWIQYGRDWRSMPGCHSGLIYRDVTLIKS